MYNREQCIFSGSTLSYEGSLTVSGGCPTERSDNQILDVMIILKLVIFIFTDVTKNFVKIFSVDPFSPNVLWQKCF